MNADVSNTSHVACPRCGKTFACRANGIGDCDCSKVVLTEEDRLLIGMQFEGCLCRSCLNEIKKKSV